jgi:hypothetical protein
MIESADQAKREQLRLEATWLKLPPSTRAAIESKVLTNHPWLGNRRWIIRRVCLENAAMITGGTDRQNTARPEAPAQAPPATLQPAPAPPAAPTELVLWHPPTAAAIAG